MELLTPDQQAQLLKNGSTEEKNKDHFPVVRLFAPGTGASWLLTRLHPTLSGLAYGLCDLGLGFPEIGSVALADLIGNELSVERDESFTVQFNQCLRTSCTSKTQNHARQKRFRRSCSIER